MQRSINVIAAAGLALGGALGMAGALVTQQNLQAILWAIDGAGLVMAAAILATKYFRAGNGVVASGFLVFAVGEGAILLSAPAAGLAGSIPAWLASYKQERLKVLGQWEVWAFLSSISLGLDCLRPDDLGADHLLLDSLAFNAPGESCWHSTEGLGRQEPHQR